MAVLNIPGPAKASRCSLPFLAHRANGDTFWTYEAKIKTPQSSCFPPGGWMRLWNAGSPVGHRAWGAWRPSRTTAERLPVGRFWKRSRWYPGSAYDYRKTQKLDLELANNRVFDHQEIPRVRFPGDRLDSW